MAVGDLRARLVLDSDQEVAKAVKAIQAAAASSGTYVMELREQAPAIHPADFASPLFIWRDGDSVHANVVAAPSKVILSSNLLAVGSPLIQHSLDLITITVVEGVLEYRIVYSDPQVGQLYCELVNASSRPRA